MAAAFLSQLRDRAADYLVATVILGGLFLTISSVNQHDATITSLTKELNDKHELSLAKSRTDRGILLELAKRAGMQTDDITLVAIERKDGEGEQHAAPSYLDQTDPEYREKLASKQKQLGTLADETELLSAKVDAALEKQGLLLAQRAEAQRNWHDALSDQTLVAYQLRAFSNLLRGYEGAFAITQHLRESFSALHDTAGRGVEVVTSINGNLRQAVALLRSRGGKVGILQKTLEFQVLPLPTEGYVPPRVEYDMLKSHGGLALFQSDPSAWVLEAVSVSLRAVDLLSITEATIGFRKRINDRLRLIQNDVEQDNEAMATEIRELGAKADGIRKEMARQTEERDTLAEKAREAEMNFQKSYGDLATLVAGHNADLGAYAEAFEENVTLLAEYLTLAKDASTAEAVLKKSLDTADGASAR